MTSMDPSRRREWTYCLVLLLALVALFGVQQNGRWVLGSGDDAYYLAIARNFATGKGYQWNGAPAPDASPGWPLLLAGVMKVSPSFAFLNLLPMTFLLGAALIWYRILLRYVRPREAFLTVLISAVLFEWQRQALYHYSDGLFFLLASGALLVAVQINENRRPLWRLGLLAILCAGCVAVRFAGLVMPIILVAALLSGQWRPRLNRQWLGAGLALLATVATFLAVRSWTLSYASNFSGAPVKDSSGAPVKDSSGAPVKDFSGAPVKDFSGAPVKDSSGAPVKDSLGAPVKDFWVDRVLAGKAFSLTRCMRGGEWLARLFWPPTVLGGYGTALAVASNLLGWALFVVVVAWSIHAAARHQWLWLASALYCLAHFAALGNPIGRYMAPVAPLLLVATWNGLTGLPWTQRPRVLNRCLRVAGVCFLASVVLINLLILGVNTAAVRSSEFGSLWLAGEYAELGSISSYLRLHAVRDGELAIGVSSPGASPKREARFPCRVLHLLTDKQVIVVPPSVSGGPPGPTLAEWAAGQGVRFILARSSAPPARVWHMRLPLWQALHGSSPAGAASSYYVLWEIADGKAVPVVLPEDFDAPKEIPGL